LESSPKDASRFLLSKWYLDCVSVDGSAFIGYAASLRWRGLSLNYSSVLQHLPGEEVKIDSTLQELSTPQVAGSSIQWSSPRLSVVGSWEAAARPIKRTLLESAAGSIEWNCLHPRARAEILTGKGRRLAGFGYVEHLKMSIPPWQLPFDELRWGRFLSEEDALVWIDWRGAHSLNLSFHNGVQIENARLTDQGLDAGEIGLALNESLVLRDGVLVETALSMIPGIQRLFPFRILGARECKWLSRGVLKKPGAEASNGWAIHEVVRWPQKNAQDERRIQPR
jgi:hypothetical protein